MENWLDIPGYEGRYQASTLGNIRSIFRYKKVLVPRINQRYYSVTLTKPGQKNKLIRIHRLVALTFIPQVLDKPHINHIDGNKINNKVDNLEWCNAFENMDHAFKNKMVTILKGEQKPNSILTENQVKLIIDKLNDRISFTLIAKEFNVSKSCIYSIKVGRTWNYLYHLIDQTKITKKEGTNNGQGTRYLKRY